MRGWSCWFCKRFNLIHASQCAGCGLNKSVATR